MNQLNVQYQKKILRNSDTQKWNIIPEYITDILREDWGDTFPWFHILPNMNKVKSHWGSGGGGRASSDLRKKNVFPGIYYFFSENSFQHSETFPQFWGVTTNLKNSRISLKHDYTYVSIRILGRRKLMSNEWLYKKTLIYQK